MRHKMACRGFLTVQAFPFMGSKRMNYLQRLHFRLFPVLTQKLGFHELFCTVYDSFHVVFDFNNTDS